jgi:hypothetical protein
MIYNLVVPVTVSVQINWRLILSNLNIRLLYLLLFFIAITLCVYKHVTCVYYYLIAIVVFGCVLNKYSQLFKISKYIPVKTFMFIQKRVILFAFYSLNDVRVLILSALMAI